MADNRKSPASSSKSRVKLQKSVYIEWQWAVYKNGPNKKYLSVCKYSLHQEAIRKVLHRQCNQIWRNFTAFKLWRVYCVYARPNLQPTLANLEATFQTFIVPNVKILILGKILITRLQFRTNPLAILSTCYPRKTQ